MSNPIDELKALKKRIKEIAEDCSCEVLAFNVGLDKYDESVLNVVFKIGEDAVKSADSIVQEKMDAEFEDIFSHGLSDLAGLDPDATADADDEVDHSLDALADMETWFEEYKDDD